MTTKTTLLALALTVLAMIAFAANSVLCRLALRGHAIDPYSFTAIRLCAGALMLAVVIALRRPTAAATKPRVWGALYLLVYALPFSFAYVRLSTGTGALLLFGAVQLTMIGIGIKNGERPRILEWLGLVGAFAGVVFLVAPGASAPDVLGALLMVIAGIGWGLYSIAGKGANDATFVTATNFVRGAMALVPATALAWPWLALSPRGIVLAACSGALASGIGYAIWYSALKYLSATRAALVQLSVPVLAALGGVLFVAEAISFRLAISGAVILGSIAVGTTGRGKTATKTTAK